MFKTIKQKILTFRARQNPIFVLQMGRVGSTSITTAVGAAYQELKLNVPVYHSHYIANYEAVVERARYDLANPELARRDIYELDNKIREALFAYMENAEPVKIISLVRDPVARNVSTFFFAFPQFVPNWQEEEARQSLPAGELNAIFESKQYFTQTALNWFDEQIKAALALDVYAVPFNKAQGWQIYKKEWGELLLLRTEDLYRTGEFALRKFLNLPHLKMIKVNIGEEREAYELYRRFLVHPISQAYLDKTYASCLAQHFYSEAEISRFVRRWRNPNASS